jgi:hypothetical protein
MAAAVIRCQCGRVECLGIGAPILAATCYCSDCRAAARQIEAAGGPPVADPDGGTALSLFRNDRFSHSRGAELLVPHKLRADSPTSRMVASCCNSALYLRFADGRFWVSVMNNRMLGAQPEIEARLETRNRDSTLPWPDDAPRYATFPKRWLFRLLGEWFRMKLSRP